MKLKENLYNNTFSHVYVEKSIMKHPRTQRILEKFPDSTIIEIGHYKDVFCRGHQNFAIQKKAQALIIAAKQGRLVYEGARVCQSFGNDYFYYTSCMMNCIYDCDYCYLKGMYPSANIVVFVNIEDIFAEVESILEQHHVYLCVSYDTDLCAMEGITGFVREWIDFTVRHEGLTIEIRTKCGRKDMYDLYKCNERVIFAYTLSPDRVVESSEKRTASLDDRLEALRYGINKGYNIRLCFDPMIYCRDWKKAYCDMVDRVADRIDMSKVYDVSIGTFRISKDYIKKMRRISPTSHIAQFPYANIDGVYQYPVHVQNEMKEYMLRLLGRYIDSSRIFMDA